MRKTLAKNRCLNNSLRLVAGLTFVLSAVLKYLSLESFDMYIYEHQLFGYILTETLTRCLIAAELCLGVFLVAGVFPRFTKYAMLGLLSAFTVYLLLLPYVFGIDDSNCHCFGEHITLNRWQSIVKNLVLIALLLPVNPALGWRFRWPKTAFAAVAALSLVAAFSINTPSYIDKALYGQRGTIDGELFRTTMLETEGGEAFLQGKQVVCFYSTSCRYCRKAAKKVHIAMQKEKISGERIKIVFWNTNHNKTTGNFFAKSDVPPLENVEIAAETFINITHGIMPVIAFVNDGSVVETHKYIELNEKQIKDFLSEK